MSDTEKSKDSSIEEQIIYFDDLLNKFKDGVKKETKISFVIFKFIYNLIFWFLIYLTIYCGFSFLQDNTENIRCVIAILLTILVVFGFTLWLGSFFYELLFEKIDEKYSRKYVFVLKTVLKQQRIRINQKSINFILKKVNDREKNFMFGNTMITSFISSLFTYFFTKNLNSIDLYSISTVIKITEFVLTIFSIIALLTFVYNSFDNRKYLNILRNSTENILWETTFYPDIINNEIN